MSQTLTVTGLRPAVDSLDKWKIGVYRLTNTASETTYTMTAAKAGMNKFVLVGVDEVASDPIEFAPTVATRETGSISCGTTTGSTTITSSAGFLSNLAGMFVSGTGIPAGTQVRKYTDTSNMEISKAATATGTATLTFTNTPYVSTGLFKSVAITFTAGDELTLVAFGY